MQTFLPYREFYLSGCILDRARLGKQRVEVLQILKTLRGLNDGWKNHPAVKMWRGCENALVEYGCQICNVWTVFRGYEDTCWTKIKAFWNSSGFKGYPTWLGRKDFHLSHKSNLIRKFPEHYGKIWPDVANNLPYVWPSLKDF